MANESISAADIAAMEAFIASLRQRAVYRDAQGAIKGLPAALYRKFWFVAKAPTGPLIAPPVQLKAAAEAAVLEARFRVMDVTLKLQQAALGQRRVSPALLAQWQRDARHWTKVLNGANAALARGGFAEMGAAGSSQWQHAAQIVAKRFTDLDVIEARIKTGGYGLGAQQQRLLQHVGQVVDGGRATYENTVVDHVAETLRHDEFRRLLGSADHCRTSSGRTGCVEAARMGWVPRSRLILIGDCTCHNGCHCTIISRRAGRDARLGIT